MFYCEKCRKERNWPESLGKSYGQCELCDKTGECHDRPCSSLPDSRGARKIDEVMEGANLSVGEEPPLKRPTLGVIPRWRWVELRIDDILGGLKRYADAKEVAPRTLLEEFDEHQRWLRSNPRKGGK